MKLVLKSIFSSPELLSMLRNAGLATVPNNKVSQIYITSVIMVSHRYLLKISKDQTCTDTVLMSYSKG